MSSKEKDKTPDISVVVPVKNEAENIRPLVDEITAALRDVRPFEIVYVNDGSDDDTPSVLEKTKAEVPEFRYVTHAKSCGQSQAVATGVKYAKGRLIATLDGDGQNDPADIPGMIELYEKDADNEKLLVAGHRHKRKDTAVKRISSKLANGIRKRLLKDDTPDTGCGIKLFSRALFLDLPRFDHMHRFLPALVIRAGGHVVSMHVNHRARERGVSKYGFWGRLWVGIFDVAGVMWLMRRSHIPEIERDA